LPWQPKVTEAFKEISSRSLYQTECFQRQRVECHFLDFITTNPCCHGNEI